MLPLFEHEHAERARAIAARLKESADLHWEEHDLQRFKYQPYSALLAALLSPRTRTEDTRNATRRLFELAETPEAMAQLPYDTVFEILHDQDVTFPESKAQYVLDLSQQLAERHAGIVPRTVAELTQFPGVGWKVALLTLWIAYRIAPEICVDVHVARIGKRLGFVNSKTSDPQKVSRELMDVVPHDLWGEWNPIFVYFGKMRCTTTNPRCDGCPIHDLCDRVGV